MTEECAELRKLNLQTFTAEEKKDIEGKSWREFLEKVLAEDFLLRRSDGTRPNEGKQEMLERIDESGPVLRRCPVEAEMRAWCTDTLGVVAGPVEMEIDGTRRRFQNVKVFVGEDGSGWTCVYWQVTEAPVAPVARD